MSSKSLRSAGFVLLLTMASVCPWHGPAAAAGDDLVIIANLDIPENSIETKDLQRIYLGKQTLWKDDTSIVPVMLKEGSLHDEFVETMLDRSVQRFVTYWRQMVFTGKGIPPRSFSSEAELLEFVSQTTGSLGYVSAGADLSGVKTLDLD